MAGAGSAASAPSQLRGLSVGALGVGLVLVLSAAWGTGVLYLAARLGLGSPVRLARLDGVHLYTGVVGGVFVVAKIVAVRRRRAGPGQPWERWMSRSLLLLYGTVLVSGVLALAPLPARWPAYAVQLHLISSVWAVFPTSWHVLHHGRRLVPKLLRAPSLRVAAALVAVPALILVAVARPVTPLSRVDGDGVWVRAGPGRVPVERLAVTPDGRTILAAGGDALYTSTGGRRWQRTALPAPASDAAPGFVAATGHQHVAAATRVQAVVVTARQAYVATTRGLYRSPVSGAAVATRLDLPGRALDELPVEVGYPGTDVRAVAVRPGVESELWTAGSAGALQSTDAGRSWTRRVDGLANPSEMAAVAYLGTGLFGSDGTGIFSWTGGRWRRTIAQPAIAELAAGADSHALLATTTAGALANFTGTRCHDLTAPGRPRVHQSHPTHPRAGPLTVAAASGRLYAAGTADGVSASSDGGRTWIGLGGGLGDRTPAQVVPFGGGLWAATDDGLYRYPLRPVARAATRRWWTGLLGAAVAAALCWVGLAARGRRPDA